MFDAAPPGAILRNQVAPDSPPALVPDSIAASMGDAIAAPPGRNIHFTVRMAALQGAYPEIIEDGHPTTLLDKSASTKADETREFDYVSDGKRHWFRLNVRSSDGALLIVGNPIYLNF